MKKLSVVLSGVGLSGYAGIALIELFEDLGIKPKLLVGCSAGSFISSLWAMGVHSKEIIVLSDELIHLAAKRKINYLNSLSFFKSWFGPYNHKHALLKIGHLERFFERVFNDIRLEELSIPTLIQTTIVDEGLPLALDKGLVRESVYASNAMLPFYPAKLIEDKWLGEGALSRPMPLQPAIQSGSDVIFALNADTVQAANSTNFLSFWSAFVQKSIKKSMAAQTTLDLDLHVGETYLIPIKAQIDPRQPTKILLKEIIDIARADIERKRPWIEDALTG